MWGGKAELFDYSAQQLTLNTMWTYSWAQKSWNATPMTSYADLHYSWFVRLRHFLFVTYACRILIAMLFACFKSCSSWMYKSKLYTFGGQDPVTAAISDKMFVLNTASVAPWRWVEYSNWTLSTSGGVVWPKTQGRVHTGFRFMQDCQVLPNWPSLNINTSVVMMFGGMNYNGSSNDMYIYDLENSTWFWVQQKTNAPMPRAHHATALIGVTIYMFRYAETSIGDHIRSFALVA